MRRARIQVAADLDDLERLLDALERPVVVIFDADNTLARQGATAEEFREAVTAALDRFRRHPSVARVTVVTNGPERGVPGMVHRGNKPWTRRRRLELDGSPLEVWVVGDQVLTDGVLAWRLGATFVHLVFDEAGEDLPQSVMRRVGRGLSRLLFDG